MTASRLGFVRGYYYADYVGDVQALRRAGRESEAQQLLLQLVDAAEAEARVEKWQVPPWYYEQLAISYRRCKEPQSEIAILERFARNPYTARDHPLLQRLGKARARVQGG